MAAAPCLTSLSLRMGGKQRTVTSRSCWKTLNETISGAPLPSFSFHMAYIAYTYITPHASIRQTRKPNKKIKKDYFKTFVSQKKNNNTFYRLHFTGVVIQKREASNTAKQSQVHRVGIRTSFLLHTDTIDAYSVCKALTGAFDTSWLTYKPIDRSIDLCATIFSIFIRE